MKAKVTTTIPVRNGEAFILETLDSLAGQTRRPDRVIVLDNCSTDRTAEIVRNFRGMPVEYLRNEKDLGVFGNFNRCLDFAPKTDYLHILHADDLVAPGFYEEMTRQLEDTKGFGLGWCLDERIDEQNRTLSVSGKADRAVEVLGKDEFLKRKAEIGNQAFAATLMKTGGKTVPCRFPTDMPILGDMVYWAAFGAHCDKLVHVHRLLAKYRWHGSNSTHDAAPSIQALILDEWKTIEINEALRGQGEMGFYRSLKLRGLMAVRSGIKAKRFRQRNNFTYAREIVGAAQKVTGLPLWMAGQVLVEVRDLVVYKIQKRPRHPKNMFS